MLERVNADYYSFATRRKRLGRFSTTETRRTPRQAQFSLQDWRLGADFNAPYRQTIYAGAQ